MLLRSLAPTFSAVVLAVCFAVPVAADQPLHTAANNDTHDAAVAYDSARDRYLIVYVASFGRLEAQIRNSDGSVVDDFISLLPPTPGVVYREPRATYKAHDDRYIVTAVMENRSLPIATTRLTVSAFEADGHLIWTYDVPGADASVVTPDVVADTFADSCCILVTWQQARGSIYARQLDALGRFVGDRIEIHSETAAPGTYAFNPRIAYQRSPRDQFLVVYQHARGSNSVLEARVVFPTNSVPGSRQVLATLDENPSVHFGQRFRGGVDLAWDETGDLYLASWLDRTSLKGLLLNSTGSPRPPVRILFTERAASGDNLANDTPEVVAASGAGRFLVSHPRKLGAVFGPGRPAWWIHGWWVDAAGTSVEVAVSSWWFPEVAGAPAGGWSPVLDKAFVAWERQESRPDLGPRDLYWEHEPLP